LYILIQIALLERIPVVVEHGLRKSDLTKLFMLHTENQPDYQFESEANALKAKNYVNIILGYRKYYYYS
jgi:hypothetical protein